MHRRGLGGELYHPPGQSAAAGAPGGRRSPQGLSSCGRNPEVGVSRSPPPLTHVGTTSGSLGLLQEHWGCRRKGHPAPAAPLQVPGQGGEEKCPHLWRRGRGSAAASSWASSRSQHCMAGPCHPPLSGSAARSQRSHPGGPRPSHSSAFQALPSSASSLLEAQMDGAAQVTFPHCQLRWQHGR